MAFYVDTSALVKLVAAEPETPAFQSWRAQQHPDLVAGDLVRTELLRAARRLTPAHVQAATEVLASVRLTRLGERVFEQAGFLDPPSLRSLDAIHLASALNLGRDLEGMVTYDSRLAEAAHQNAIPVISPGAGQ
ncbi:MAG: type II toxin-antitoxin system VapC family toxin [Acidimicrobiia bacterium]|nr:type II toxin-antitoxin system VapC family toxin [Acidimicrobiia bacterium]MYB73535.1 type II toxin-antitoxin system VapC family toxin [Acidimicrobiia bacterium]MYI00276.1 type II toxin-antitoxin system VapC family toxin [Acidimicrobiia bacterium]